MPIQPNTIVRLCDYCVAEFSVEQFTLTPSPTFYKLYNVDTGTHHIYNANGSVTGNSQDYSATYIGSNQYVYMDQEVTIPYWVRYPNAFSYTVPGAYDTFNKIKFHFVSGFDFAGIPGFILTVKNRMNNGSYVIFAQLLITPDWFVDIVKNNPSPIYLADVMFDKYVEVMVPAVQQINLDYYAVPANMRSGEFGALITNDGSSFSGLVQDAPIVMSVDECTRIETKAVGEDVYEIYVTDQHYESVVNLDALHQRFGAYIGEAVQFDAIEFYGTMVDDSGSIMFVEELINMLTTNPHDDWVIGHQLTIHEWVNGSKIVTGKYMQLQEDSFDQPMYYRPILKYSGNDIAFEIDYTCRLYNRMNGDQIIRVGSYTSYSAAKYGKTLSVIPLVSPVNSHIIYNKIVKSSLETTDLFVEQTYVNIVPDPNAGTNTGSIGTTSMTKVVTYIPMFFNVNAISVSSKDVLPDNDDAGNTLIYKQGDLHFILTPFDNMLKFKVHTLNTKGLLVPMDLSDFGSFNIVMMMNNKKVRFTYLSDSGTSNVKVGELMFKIPQTDAEQLITSNTREFYITLIAKDNTETVLYNGFWNDVTETDIVKDNITKITAQQALLTNNTIVPFSSVGTVDLPTFTAKPILETTTLANLSIDIPGYVSAGNSNNDISIVHSIIPQDIKPSQDTKQAKADAALGKVLGVQAGNTKDTSVNIAAVAKNT